MLIGYWDRKVSLNCGNFPEHLNLQIKIENEKETTLRLSMKISLMANDF